MTEKDMRDWTVVIVDDEPDNVNVAQKVLTYNGAKVHVARNGLEGLALLNQVRPTFVLLDLSMPEMDGWEMLRQVRSKNLLQGVPIIALTAHAMAGDKERVLEAGFNGYIAKPFRIDSFLADIQACLRDFG
ncbi:MAG: response regulator [Anaerolineae bacterium]|nr:response regulator [Anaerolineae bacterium]MDW8170952.1 response regulator [Anaerolineae bacterium]